MQTFGNVSSVDYMLHANKSLVTIAQIETKEALANVRKIS